MNPSTTSSRIQRLLEQLQNGSVSARGPLLEHSLERFRLLARRMFRRQPELRSLAETDDVLQEACVRLHRALGEVRPADVPAYFGLAARQIRWVLRDLARKQAASRVRFNGQVADGESTPDRAGEPADLFQWSELHEKIDALPPQERETFDLLFYQGLGHAEAAELLQVSTRTLRRRWQQARLLLRDLLRGHGPDAES